MFGSKNGAEDLSRQLNDKLEEAGLNSRLKFKTSQALNDPDLMAVQQKMETSPRLGFVGEMTEVNYKRNECFK